MPPRPTQLNALKQLLPRASAQVERSFIPRTSSFHPTTYCRTQSAPKPFISRREFSSTPIVHKKKGRAEREAEENTKSSPTEVDDPFDFSPLTNGLEKNLEKLKNDLSKLRTGGRFNPEVLENLKVVISHDGKGGSERLGDLAQVLPKGGRSLVILVGEKEHVKPIISAIQSSKDLNLQPQPDSHNASQLNVPIPPPTKESRDQALAAASKAGEVASTGVRNARAVMQKKLRGMELKKVVRPDDLKKAHKEMEKIVEKGVQDVKKTVEVARKSMEQA